MAKNKSEELRKAFNCYCEAHPELRFWQSLRAFGGFKFLVAADDLDIQDPTIFRGCKDTFFFEHRTE